MLSAGTSPSSYKFGVRFDNLLSDNLLDVTVQWYTDLGRQQCIFDCLGLGGFKKPSGLSAVRKKVNFGPDVLVRRTSLELWLQLRVQCEQFGFNV